uniref:Uncharacterized protein n=1 Tax=Setaria digitata TaxID=48799 RepID=A0A915PHW8_9BILA
MKNNTATKIAIGVCMAVALRKRISPKKQTESAGRLPSRLKRHSQVSRHLSSPKHALHLKKPIDSAKSMHSVSNESLVSPLLSETEKSISEYSSENYPPAIVREQKEAPKLQLSPEKPRELSNKIVPTDTNRLSLPKLLKAENLDQIKSTESPTASKLLPAEESPSPTDVISIDSYCYCGQDVAISMNEMGELNENWKVELLPTIVKPLSFDPYSPEDLTQVEGKFLSSLLSAQNISTFS